MGDTRLKIVLSDPEVHKIVLKSPVSHDGGNGEGIVITDVPDINGGTVRTITATEIGGTLNITQNGVWDVSSYAYVRVQVPKG